MLNNGCACVGFWGVGVWRVIMKRKQNHSVLSFNRLQSTIFVLFIFRGVFCWQNCLYCCSEEQRLTAKDLAHAYSFTTVMNKLQHSQKKHDFLKQILNMLLAACLAFINVSIRLLPWLYQWPILEMREHYCPSLSYNSHLNDLVHQMQL